MVETTDTQTSRYQAFPASGPLNSNMDLDRARLKQRLDQISGHVYCYIVKTVQRGGGMLVQTGSGPNFQGGLLTLCTCKWSMRAGKARASDWKGIWIAGLTGAPVGTPGRNHLFFLTRIEQVLASHRDLWQWLTDYAPGAPEAKATDKHRLGDLYRPIDPNGDPFDPQTYAPPRRDHTHYHDAYWNRDVDHLAFGRHPSLLVGAPEDTYLWSEPRVRVPFHVGRGYKVADLGALWG